MSNKKEFDILLGGTNRLPDIIKLKEFYAARRNEIEVMQRSLDEPSGTKMAFQRLPKHMRRRVMAHVTKRLPRRLREIHKQQQIKSGVPVQPKRPSRKFRRRPKNLYQEYVRRQAKVCWLETHIWHAKRFRMVQLWGYKLPERPYDKAFRACYRATAKHCLVQDLSYYCCAQVKGPSERLINALKSLCDARNGLTVGAKKFLQGNREGEAILYKDATLSTALGKVSFTWMPQDNTGVRVVWLWAHCAFYADLLDALRNCFDDETVAITNLKCKLNRFRLTGPLSHTLLQNALIPAERTNGTAWFKEYSSVKENRRTEQIDYWTSTKGCRSAGQLSPNSVVCLNVEDPRFNFPAQRTKAVDAFISEPSQLTPLPCEQNVGAIWRKECRQKSTDNMLSTAELCNERSKQLVPGSRIERDAQVLPIMLIQRPGVYTKSLAYGSGWDLIVPFGWGAPTWLALIMWGGRAGGLRETNSVCIEENKFCFEPDTNAGRDEEKRIAELYVEKYFRLPPNKRVNYNKFSIRTPFTFPWQCLLNNWGSLGETNYFVLRDRKTLQIVRDFVSNGKTIPDDILALNCLVPVIVTTNDGVPHKHAVICCPEANDFSAGNKLDKVVEPFCDDPNQTKRKTLRKEHRMLLKRLRRRRIRAKRLNKPVVNHLSKSVSESYLQTMRSLWLPQFEDDVKTSCCRNVMGFITAGAFSFSIGSGKGLGYIAIGSFRNLINGCRVLVRNTNSRLYKAATMTVNI